MHVEYFPNHISVEVSLQVIDDIILILSHGQIGESRFKLKILGNFIDIAAEDRMTSSTSTFPYTADKCEKMLGLVRPLKGKIFFLYVPLETTSGLGQPPSGYLFCVLGRHLYQDG